MTVAPRVQLHSGGSGDRSLGTRVRELRLAAGMTQSELAGERFSKEYVSQIERGKTRPTRETVEWIAARLRVDAGFLEEGISADERGRVEARLAQADALAEAEEFEQAAELYERARTSVVTAASAELEVRVICGAWKALVPLGRVREALDLLVHARELTERSTFSDVERAEVLYRMGVCRHLLQSNATALALLNEALALAERSGLPSDLLTANILHWRSRCYRRQRDFEAAREDVERALELAEAVHDPKAIGHLYFQASILAERQGRWVLARSYAERAKSHYEEVADRSNVARLLNNLGGLNFLLGKPEDAVRFLKDAFATALEVGNDADAAQAVSSLAQVHVRTGEWKLAEEQARHALRLLGDRVDYIHEIGSAQLVLGRALLEQNLLGEAEEAFRGADASFEQFGSASHRAAVWVAQGDLAARRGDDRGAAHLYRLAAEALQDVRF
jgi:tetratricopeptide (TPR) repeat protein